MIHDSKSNHKTSDQLQSIHRKIYRTVIDFQERFRLLENKFNVSIVNDALHGMSITEECIDDLMIYGQISLDGHERIIITFADNNNEVIFPYEVLDYNDVELDEYVKNEFVRCLDDKIEHKKEERKELEHIIEKLILAKVNIKFNITENMMMNNKRNNFEYMSEYIKKKYNIEEEFDKYKNELDKNELDKNINHKNTEQNDKKEI